MNFESFIERKEVLITEGSMHARLIHHVPKVHLDPQIANAGLVYNPESAKVLRDIVKEYLAVGREFGLPMYVLTNTWRANR